MERRRCAIHATLVAGAWSPVLSRGFAAFVALAALVALLAWGWRALRGGALVRLVVAGWGRLERVEAVRRLSARHPRTWAFLARRLTPAGVFGLHLTLGLAVSLLALGAFAKVADDVLERDDLARVDAIVANAVAARLAPTDRHACQVASALGAPITITGIGVLVAAVLLTRRRRWLAGAWLATLAGGGLLNYLLKAAFHRTRPTGARAFLHDASWSFPSGHTMGATVAYGMLAFLLLLSARARGWRASARVGLITGAMIVVLLIGASRLCLGVHYATDVIGAFAAGAMWLSACIAGVGALRRRDAARALDTV